jgi:hypothetical protein
MARSATMTSSTETPGGEKRLNKQITPPAETDEVIRIVSYLNRSEIQSPFREDQLCTPPED